MAIWFGRLRDCRLPAGIGWLLMEDYVWQGFEFDTR
jgi:hypothetical protein